ncbi:hypothetical protein V6246_05865 [Algibacter sp. TI.3.09]|uniref:hypothetical protein n=1 Tax=Algibacter sp. TI.3.09 TaxID=3121298 RepID=UPI00311DDD86
MYKTKIFIILIAVVYVFFVVFEFNGNPGWAFYFESLIIPLVVARYIISVKPKNKLFLMFFVLFALADLLAIFDKIAYPDTSSDYYQYAYYLGNSLYVLAYFMLFFKMCQSINFKYVFRNLKIHLFVLLILDAYLIYVLYAIEQPNLLTNSIYFLENTYNIIILLVLSLSLLNYFYRDNEKSLFLFFGVLCLVFSEVIDIANIYISQSSLLNFLATTLVLGAFYFFYEQSRLPNVSPREDEHYPHLK